jgi:hypothetical protein
MDLSAHNLDLIVRHGSLTIEFVRTIVLWLGRLTIPSQICCDDSEALCKEWSNFEPRVMRLWETMKAQQRGLEW